MKIWDAGNWFCISIRKMVRPGVRQRPKDSGIQNLYKDYHQDRLIASNMHWKWRADAMTLVKSYEYGIVSIASEQGAGIKSINTQRQEMIMQQ